MPTRKYYTFFDLCNEVPELENFKNSQNSGQSIKKIIDLVDNFAKENCLKFFQYFPCTEGMYVFNVDYDVLNTQKIRKIITRDEFKLIYQHINDKVATVEEFQKAQEAIKILFNEDYFIQKLKEDYNIFSIKELVQFINSHDGMERAKVIGACNGMFSAIESYL